MLSSPVGSFPIGEGCRCRRHQEKGGVSLPPLPRTPPLWASAPGVAEDLAATVPRSKTAAVMGLSKLAKGWRKGAVKGNAEDQYRLACCYDAGSEGVKRDKVAAAAWFGKAAEQEHMYAQVALGACHGHGAGVAQNLELAATLYRKAAAGTWMVRVSSLGATLAAMGWSRMMLWRWRGGRKALKEGPPSPSTCLAAATCTAGTAFPGTHGARGAS